MEGLRDWWNSVLDIPGAAWIIYPSLLVVLILIAYYVLQLFRDMAIGGSPASEDYLGTFRKMRDEGKIEPEEYKKMVGLVPIPETEEKETDLVSEKGVDALTEAAKAAIKKAATKKADDSPEKDEDEDL